MLGLRRAEERGRADFGWLDSRHSFSFGDYYDPAFLGFGPLRVINDDRIAPGGGFPTHPHRDMEIVTYVLDGALQHKDSLGTGSVIHAGDVQRMTAGTGIRHSEFNASQSEPVRMLQIWIVPEENGLTPGYEQKTFESASKRGRLRLLASRGGRDGSIDIRRDVDLYGSILAPRSGLRHELKEGRIGWIQVARGELEANGEALREGDGLGLARSGAIELAGVGSDECEFLLFDMAA
jgi:redox-sensitive bicupin YhaK (pirin superfamily)